MRTATAERPMPTISNADTTSTKNMNNIADTTNSDLAPTDTLPTETAAPRGDRKPLNETIRELFGECWRCASEVFDHSIKGDNVPDDVKGGPEYQKIARKIRKCYRASRELIWQAFPKRQEGDTEDPVPPEGKARQILIDEALEIPVAALAKVAEMVINDLHRYVVTQRMQLEQYAEEHPPFKRALKDLFTAPGSLYNRASDAKRIGDNVIAWRRFRNLLEELQPIQQDQATQEFYATLRKKRAAEAEEAKLVAKAAAASTVHNIWDEEEDEELDQRTRGTALNDESYARLQALRGQMDDAPAPSSSPRTNGNGKHDRQDTGGDIPPAAAATRRPKAEAPAPRRTKHQKAEVENAVAAADAAMAPATDDAAIDDAAPRDVVEQVVKASQTEEPNGLPADQLAKLQALKAETEAAAPAKRSPRARRTATK